LKLTKQENWHVKVSPGYYCDSKQAYSYCKRIADEIKQHCDSAGDTEIDCDTIEYCEFCKREWEEESDGEPLCCEQAVVDWERSKYCYNCFQETDRLFKRESDSYHQRHEPIRCERCKRWFCWECFDWHWRGMCDECKEEVEKLKQEEEHKKKFKGRRVTE